MDENLQQGIKAYGAGKRDAARDFFALALEDDPENEEAWRWTYKVAHGRDEKIVCLKHIARINPGDRNIWYQLDQMLITPSLLEDYHLQLPGKHESISLPGLFIYMLGGAALTALILIGAYFAYAKWMGGF